jgi:hypothetical protein
MCLSKCNFAPLRRGDLTVVPADKTLRSFVEWQKRHQGGGWEEGEDDKET